MPRESLDRLREALRRLPTATRVELTAEWRRLYPTNPPARISRALLIAAIAYRVQEAALGGLRPELQRRLRHIAEQVSRGEEPALTATPRLKPGTRLLREWGGKTHTVIVLEDGFEYGGERYQSLTQIAVRITCAHWSGPRFFGLRRAPAQPADPMGAKHG
jgi:Protein of unknown function (DUF2924)